MSDSTKYFLKTFFGLLLGFIVYFIWVDNWLSFKNLSPLSDYVIPTGKVLRGVIVALVVSIVLSARQKAKQKT
jgi:Na+/proline symporter